MVRKAHNQLKHKKDTFIHKTVLFLSVKMLSVAVFWSVLQHTSITSGLFLCQLAFIRCISFEISRHVNKLNI